MIVDRGRIVLAQDLGVDPDAIMVSDEYDQPFSICEGAECLPIPVERAFWDRSDVLDGSDASPGSVEALNRLHERGMLAGYITRRPPQTRELTEAWLRRHGYPDVPVHFVGVAAAIASYDLCKSTVCRQIGATHLVDDHATEISQAAAAGIEVVVVDAQTGRAARDEALSRHPGAVKVPTAAAAAELLEQRLDMAA
jgi:beta-phosphoglucomutase-like phosphatase (HAD superfamily)